MISELLIPAPPPPTPVASIFFRFDSESSSDHTTDVVMDSDIDADTKSISSSVQGVYVRSRPTSNLYGTGLNLENAPLSFGAAADGFTADVLAALARSRPYENADSCARSVHTTKSCLTVTRAVRKHQWDIHEATPITPSSPFVTATKKGHSIARRDTLPSNLRKRFSSLFRSKKAKVSKKVEENNKSPSPTIAKPVAPRRATVSTVSRPFRTDNFPPIDEDEPEFAAHVKEGIFPGHVRRTVSFGGFNAFAAINNQLDEDEELDEITAEATMVSTSISRDWGFKDVFADNITSVPL